MKVFTLSLGIVKSLKYFTKYFMKCFRSSYFADVEIYGENGQNQPEHLKFDVVVLRKVKIDEFDVTLTSYFTAAVYSIK